MSQALWAVPDTKIDEMVVAEWHVTTISPISTERMSVVNAYRCAPFRNRCDAARRDCRLSDHRRYGR